MYVLHLSLSLTVFRLKPTQKHKNKTKTKQKEVGASEIDGRKTPLYPSSSYCAAGQKTTLACSMATPAYLPHLLTSGLPVSPAETFLRHHCPFPAPLGGCDEAEGRLHFGHWCVIHEDVAPFHLTGPLFVADGAVLRPPPLLAFTLRGRQEDGEAVSSSGADFSLDKTLHGAAAASSTSMGGVGGPAAAEQEGPRRAAARAGTPRPFRRPPRAKAPRAAVSSAASGPEAMTPRSAAVAATTTTVANAAAAARPALLRREIAVGPFVFIGDGVVSEAVRVQAFGFIGPGAVLGPQVEVLEGACVAPGAVVPPESLLAPYTVYDGVPAVPRGRVDPAAHRQVMRELLRRMMPRPPTRDTNGEEEVEEKE
eukprot:gene11704-8052_t